MRNTLFVVFLLASPALAGEPASDPSRAFTGTWKGTSTCTNREVTPGCKDEVVVYDVKPDKPGAVTLKGDKIVNGERLWMGDLPFTWDAERKEWISRFDGGRVQVIWHLRVDGDTLTGTLEHLPEKVVVRRVAAKRG